MQQKQGNFKLWRFGIPLLAAGLISTAPAQSAGIAQPKAGDPILDGGPPGPCHPQNDSPDYVAGTDAGGHPVAPADLAGDPIPVPGNLAVPLKARPGHDPAYVQVDGKKLDALLNPAPSCPEAKAPGH